MDLSQLSDSDLQALAVKDFSKVSTEGLQYLANPQRPKPVVPVKDAGFSPTNLALEGGQSLVGGVKSIIEGFGAGSAPAEYLEGVSKKIGSYISPERQAEIQRRTALEKKAAETGTTVEELSTALGGVTEAPATALVKGVSSSIPTVALSLGAAALGATLGAPIGIAAAVGIGAKFLIGALQGAGEVKGDIYSNVKAGLEAKGMKPELAAKQAEAAQDYFGENKGNIAISSLLGAAAGGTGAESKLLEMVSKPVAKKAAEKAIEKAVPGFTRRTATEFTKEAVPEGLQAGQGQYSQNVAMTRAGMETPEMQGVLGAAARDALIGGITGGAVSTVAGGPKAVKPVEDLTRRASTTAGQEALDVLNPPPPPPPPIERVKDVEPVINPPVGESVPVVSEREIVQPPAGAIAPEGVGVGAVVPPIVPAATGEAEQPAALDIPEEIKQDQTLASQPTYTEGSVSEVPVSELKLSEDVPQFKSDANQSGVVQASKLEGKFDRRLASPIQVWQRNDGKLEVISGRHRLDLAQRSGEKTIPAQIYKESEGFNADMARMLDIELNVKDGRGKVKDYVSFFKEFGLQKDQARSEGLLNTAIGRQAYEIADAGSPSLIAAHFNKEISDDAATSIAINAPKDDALQNLGMAQVKDGKSINHAVNFMRSAMAAGFKGQEGSGDLFGFDDSFAKEAEAVTKEATKQQREARQQLSAIKGAAKSPEKAKLGGVDVKNIEQTKAKIAELEKTVNDLENFHTNPELYKKLRQDAGLEEVLTPPALEELKMEEDRSDNADQEAMFSLRGKSEGQITAFEQSLRTLLNKFGLKDVGLKLSEGMRDEGSYAEKLIQIAADSANPIRALRHESVHALRELGFFTDAQWNSLSKMAKNKWIDQYLKQRDVDGKPLKAGEESRYDAYMREYKGDMEKITEEAVADAFADFDANKAPAGMIRAILQKLRNLFQSIKSALTKMESAEQIFSKAEKGALKPKGKQVKGEANADIRKNLRSQAGKEKAGTEKGQEALDITGGLGRVSEQPDSTYMEKVREAWDNATDNPKATASEAKAAAVKFIDLIQTKAFSSDAAINNSIRRQVNEFVKDNEQAIGTMLNISQSQVVHADALANLFLTSGNLKYDKELYKYEAVEDKANIVELAKQLGEIKDKYGLTQAQTELIGHTAFEAKRLKSLLQFNNQVDQEVTAMRAEADKLAMDGKEVAAYALREKATRRSKETKFIHMTAAEIAAGNKLFKVIPELNGVVETWNQMRDNAANMLVDSGLWSKEEAEFLLSNADYVPFFREEQLEKGKGPKEYIRGLMVQAQEKKLKGSNKPVNDIFDNMNRWTQYSVNRAVRNRSALALIDTAAEFGQAKKIASKADGENAVRVWRNGKEEFYDMADPMFVEAFTGLESITIPAWKWASTVANILRQSVVLNPLFTVAQIPQDSFAAMFTSGLKPQYALQIPVRAVKEFAKTLAHRSATNNELRKYGVVGVRDFTSQMARLDAQVYAGMKASPGIIGKLKSFLEHIAMAGDNAVRQATYEAATAQGLSKAEALEKSFEIWNIRRKGTSQSLAIASQVIPFFGAYLAAQNVMLKTITLQSTSPTERNAALGALVGTTASVMTLSLLYAMMNGDDEDYLKKPAAIRDRMLMVPGTNGFGIPLRSDLFSIPKIITEHMYLMITDKGYEDGRKFRDSIKNVLGNAFFSPTVVPQAIKPGLEVLVNYDFFQGRPLIGEYQKRLEKERQFNESTSEISKMMGKFGVSPIAVDHLMRGMFGSAGGLIIYMTNPLLHSDPNVDKPTMSARDMLATLPGASSFVSKEKESALKADFYVLRDEVGKVTNTLSDLKQRSPEKIAEYIADPDVMAKLGVSKAVQGIDRKLGEIRKAMTRISNLPTSVMDSDEKQKQIKQLRESETEMLKAINVKNLREMAKI